jgi:RNA recognition motif-containing protein
VNIYVSNIAFNATTQDLRQLFESYGAVDKVNIITDRDTGQSHEAHQSSRMIPANP